MKKVQPPVMLVLHNVRMLPSNVRKKNKRTTKYDKSTIICDVGTTQCKDDTIKGESGWDLSEGNPREPLKLVEQQPTRPQNPAFELG